MKNKQITRESLGDQLDKVRSLIEKLELVEDALCVLRQKEDEDEFERKQLNKDQKQNKHSLLNELRDKSKHSFS